MIDEAHIEKLAALSRISVSKEEKTKLAHDIDAILSYIEDIQKLDISDEKTAGEVRNVMREDGEPHEGGRYSEALLREAPETEGGYVVVKKIIDQG